MKKNVGSADKIVRIVLGVLIAVWGIIAQNWLGLIADHSISNCIYGNLPFILVIRAFD